MKGFVRRLAVIGSACALVAGLGTGAVTAVTVLTAAPALAANGPCGDNTNAQPTALHYHPSDSSQTVKFLNVNDWITSSCVYYDNTGENRWYMQVNYIGPGNNHGYGYVWVQRLSFGSYHLCDDNGTTYGIGSGQCPLLPTNGSTP